MDSRCREVKAKAKAVVDRLREESGTDVGFDWNLVRHMAVFGLGSLENSRTARYQLAVALLLAAELVPNLDQPVEAYDPVFTQVDKAVLEAYGWKVLPSSSKCCPAQSAPELRAFCADATMSLALTAAPYQKATLSIQISR